MFSALKKFFWPSRDEIGVFDKLKWYQGFNFWYMVILIEGIILSQMIASACIELTYDSKFSGLSSLAGLGVFKLSLNIPWIYLLYKRYSWAYIMLGLSYYFLNYLPSAGNKYFQIEDTYVFMFFYAFGIFAFRISWYYGKQFPSVWRQLKKDLVVAFALMEICFFSAPLFNV